MRILDVAYFGHRAKWLKLPIKNTQPYGLFGGCLRFLPLVRSMRRSGRGNRGGNGKWLTTAK